MVNNFKESDTWRIQLTMVMIFMCPIETSKDRVIHAKNDELDTIILKATNEVIERRFRSTSFSISSKFRRINGRQRICL